MRSIFYLVVLAFVGCRSAAPPEPLPDLNSPREAAGPPTAPQDTELSALRSKKDLTESDFLRLVALSNPKIRSLRAEVEAAEGRKQQAGLGPNPSLFASLEEAPTNPARPGKGKTVFGLSYPLILGGRLGAGVEAAGREREFLEALMEIRRREILRDARKALYDYIALREEAALEEEIRKLTSEFNEVVRKRRAERSVLELELIRTTVELATQEVETASLAREAEKAAFRLRAWVGDPQFDAAVLRVELPTVAALESPESYEKKLVERHPAFRAAKKAIDLIEAQQTLARREVFPDFTLSAGFGRGAEDTNGNQDSIFELALDVPLPIFNRNQGRIVELEALRRKAEFDFEDQRVGLLVDLREAVRNVERELPRIKTYRETVLPEVARGLEQATTLYREGKVLSLDVLDAQRTLTRARRTHIAARRDLARSIAELENLIGDKQ